MRLDGLAMAMLLGSGVAMGQSDAPFYVPNLSPLSTLYGLPAAEDGRITARGQFALRTTMSLASSATVTRLPGEALTLDGETLRLTLSMRIGVTDRLELGADVPFVAHGGGGLDRVIDAWHDLTGLPDGDRPVLPRDELRYAYSNPSGMGFLVDRAARGLGDLRLSAAWRLLGGATARDHLALRVGLELPSGESEDLLGDGGTDFSLALAWTRTALLGQEPLSLFAGAGLVHAGDSEIEGLRARDRSWFVDGGVGWRLPRFVLLAQLRINQALFHSPVPELGDTAMQLAFGARFPVGVRAQLDLAFTEDVRPETAPDFGIHLGWRFLTGRQAPARR